MKFAPNWAGFCERQLKISKRTADRAIALLKKHGTLYFETAARGSDSITELMLPVLCKCSRSSHEGD